MVGAVTYCAILVRRPTVEAAVEVTLEAYRSTPDLDSQLARLGYAAVRGGPDQRPANADLLHSLLKPTSMTATTLAMHRAGDGQLLGVAALRWPATLDDVGFLWGPVVDPSLRGSGLGRQLLAALTEVLARHPGVKVSTTWMSESRPAAWSMFEEVGWRCEPRSALLARPLPAGIPVPADVTVRPARSGEYLHAAVAELAAADRPDICPVAARDTFAIWSSDKRYRPEGLLLVERPGGLAGAALVYQGHHETADEPAEARIQEVIVSRTLDPADQDRLRTALVAAALGVADRSGAEVARAVPESPELDQTLRAAGFEALSAARRYTTPG